MPFSDTPHTIYAPDTTPARIHIQEEYSHFPDVDVGWCTHYEPERHPVYGEGDYLVPNWTRVCSNRRRDGARFNSWCYRCLAGFPGSRFDERDADHGGRVSFTMTGY